MLGKPGKHIRLVNTIGKICATAQHIETKGGHSYNQVRVGITQEHRSSRVAIAGAALVAPIALGLDVETIVDRASEIRQLGFGHQPLA